MPLPQADDVVAFFDARRDDLITLRELVHTFAVEVDDRKAFRELVGSLAAAEKIVRIKPKQFKAKPKPIEKPLFLEKQKHELPAGTVRDASAPRHPGGRTRGERKASAVDRPGRAEKVGKSGVRLGIEPTQLVGVVQHMQGKIMAACSRGEELEYIPITGDMGELKKNDAAVFELKDAKQGRVCTVAMPLGLATAPRVEALRLALAKGFRATFSEEAMNAAKSFRAPTEADLKDGRRDMRHLPFVTIDGEDAKDFDDAVYAERKGDGFTLYVAIADVSHYVHSGSALDREGFSRSTSVYFPGFVLPMLPHALSDDLCSLRPQVDRLAFCCEMDVDAAGKVTGERTYKALFRSRARLTYNQVETALHKGEDNAAKQVGEPLLVFADCSRRLRGAKWHRGAIDLDLDEPQIQLGPDGMPTGSIARPRLEAHRLIEDAMLAANSAVAREMFRHGYAAAYRVHERPNDEKLVLVRMAAHSMGYRHPLPDGATAPQLAKFVRALQAEPKGPMIVPLVLRAMARARYSPERLGHFALAEADYLHFTSPIRRFPDLAVHRSLASAGKNVWADMTRACAWMSEREQSAERAGREVDDYYRCLLAEPLIGQEFEGTVTGVQEFGAFVRIDQPYVEGLIPVRTFGEDFYNLDELGLRLRGKRSGHSIGLGDKIKVKLKEVRPLRRQIAFSWVQVRKDSQSKDGSRRFRDVGGENRNGADFIARARAKAAAGEFASPRRNDDRPRRGRPGGGKAKFSHKRR